MPGMQESMEQILPKGLRTGAARSDGNPAGSRPEADAPDFSGLMEAIAQANCGSMHRTLHPEGGPFRTSGFGWPRKHQDDLPGLPMPSEQNTSLPAGVAEGCEAMVEGGLLDAGVAYAVRGTETDPPAAPVLPQGQSGRRPSADHDEPAAEEPGRSDHATTGRTHRGPFNVRGGTGQAAGDGWFAGNGLPPAAETQHTSPSAPAAPKEVKPFQNAGNGAGGETGESARVLSEDTSTAAFRIVPSNNDSRMPPAEARQIDPLKSPANGSETSRTAETDLIRQIVQRMTLNTAGNRSSMQIRLKPEYFGSLRMQVMSEAQVVTVRIAAQNEQVKQIIERHIHMLKAELQQHGLQIGKVEISVATEPDAWRGEDQQAAFRQAHDQHPRQHRRTMEADANGRPADLADDGVPGRRAVASGSGEVDFFA